MITIKRPIIEYYDDEIQIFFPREWTEVRYLKYAYRVCLSRNMKIYGSVSIQYSHKLKCELTRIYLKPLSKQY